MENHELIQFLLGFDRHAQVELNIDLTHPGCEGSRRARSDRRILDVKAKKDGTIEIVGTGEFKPDEEAKLDAGIYNREYNACQKWWDNLSRMQRREAFRAADVQRGWVHDEERWDELSLLQQQMILVRVDHTVTLEGVWV